MPTRLVVWRKCAERRAARAVDDWLVEYNTERSHQALKFMTPVEYRQAA